MKLIRISKLESIKDIHYLVKNEFSVIRDELDSSSDEIYIAFNDIGLGLINLSALTMLICVLGSIRKKYEYPFIGYLESHEKEMFYADPKKASFLKSSSFINLSQDLRIIDWQLKKSIPDLDFNPNTGILLVDVPAISNSVKYYYKESTYYDKGVLLYNLVKEITPLIEDVENEYEKAKSEIKKDIKKYINNDISKVFTDKEGRSLKDKVISYASEMILNSFIHGRVNPYLAVQRTGKLISITICDDGIGFVKSFEKLHKRKIIGKQALINACMHRSNDSYGIFDVLVSVIGIDKPNFVMTDTHHGFVTISNDSQILKITRNNLQTLIEDPDKINTYDTGQLIRGVRVSMDILIK